MRPPVPLCFVLLLLFAFKKRPDLAPSSQGEGATYTALFIRNDLAHNFVNFLYQTLVFRFMKFRLNLSATWYSLAREIQTRAKKAPKGAFNANSGL